MNRLLVVASSCRVSGFAVLLVQIEPSIQYLSVVIMVVLLGGLSLLVECGEEPGGLSVA